MTISWEMGQWGYQGDDQAVTLVVEDPDSHVILRADIVLDGVTHHWANLSDGQPHPGAVRWLLMTAGPDDWPVR